MYSAQPPHKFGPKNRWESHISLDENRFSWIRNFRGLSGVLVLMKCVTCQCVTDFFAK